MSTKKKKKKPNNTASKKVRAQLDVEIIQYGTPQASGTYTPNGIFRRVVSFGSSHFAELCIPFSKLPGQIQLFKIGRGKVHLILDPRTEGYINRGKEFGDVREFILPRGALEELATIDEPLHLELSPGSRGTLRVYGFEVIFKYAIPRAQPRSEFVAGAPNAPFTPPYVDTPIERHAVWVGAIAVASVAVPLLIFLFHAKTKPFSTLIDLPQEFLAQIIDPSHIRIMPRVFAEEFDPYRGITQAALWVSELQKRWSYSENGRNYKSSIAFLGTFPHSTNIIPSVATVWRKKIEETYEALDKHKSNDSSPRYYKFQADYPRFETSIAGGHQGSLRLRVERRLDKLRKAQAALTSVIVTEHKFVREFHKDRMTFAELFAKPTTGMYIGPQPAPDYLAEHEAYLSAEALAQLAENNEHRMPLPINDNDDSDPATHNATSTVWLDGTGLVLPLLNRDEHFSDAFSHSSNHGNNIIHNAQYSIAERAVPPPPPPKPRINAKDVEFVILGKREELKSCYDAALRRNASLSGTIRWRWVIDEKGGVHDPKVMASSIPDQELVFCVKSRLVTWRFPRPTNGKVTFEYPFQFVARNKSPEPQHRR